MIALKVIRNALALGVALAAVLVAACSSKQSSIAGTGSNGGNGSLTSTGAHGDVGNVGMNLTVFGTTTTQLTSINYTCTNGTSSFSGTIAIGDAQSVEQVVGGVPAASGYTCTLTGSDSAGDFCSGTVATFSVSAGVITNVVSNVTCVISTDAAMAADVTTGTVAIDAGATTANQPAFLCPGIDSFSISPAELLPPQTAAVTSVSTMVSGGTETIQWSTDCTGAGFANPTSANTTFFCGSSCGTTCHVTLTVGLIGTTPDGGSAGQVCTGVQFTSQTASVVCEGSTGASCPIGSTACGSDPTGCTGTCVNLQTDPNNCGACGVVCATSAACTSGFCNLTPQVCTSQFCAANSVRCNGNTAHNQVCTPTEALIVEQDIKQGKLTDGQLSPTTSCYECLMNNGGLNDDLVATDQGNECGDVPSTAGTLTGESGVQACLDTLNCMIAQGCDTANPPQQCFCGTAAGSACLTAGAANGPCLQNELNGLDVTTGCPSGGCGSVIGTLVEGDPTFSIQRFTNKALGSGMANTIGGFAFTNCATQCGNNL
jgi:hypothetical protein